MKFRTRPAWPERPGRHHARLFRCFLRAALAVALVTLAGASPAAAAPTTYLYWTDYSNASEPSAASVGFIGRARIDGTAVEPSFVKPWATNEFRSVAAYGPCLYVTGKREGHGSEDYTYEEAAIGRLKTDGSGFNDGFLVPNPERDQPGFLDLAVGPHGIYWSAYWYDYGAPLGHAALDGGSVNTDFADINQYNAYNSYPALNSSTLFFQVFQLGVGGSLAKVNLDGSGVQRALIPGLRVTALTATDQYVYWLDAVTGAIGRAKVDGTDVTPALVPNALSTDIEGGHLVNDGTYLYWTHGSMIARAKVDGTDLRLNFIDTGRERPMSLTIGTADSSEPPPPPPPFVPPVPPSLPDPEPEPTPLPQLPPATTPTPAPKPLAPAPASHRATKATASLRASRVRRGKSLTIRLKGVPNKAKLVVRWKPKRGKTVRRTVTVSKSRVRVVAPKKKGRYRVTVSYKGRALVKNRAVVVR